MNTFSNYIPYILIGIIAAFVPLFMIGSVYKNNIDNVKFNDYYNMVLYGPIFFAFFNVLLFYIINTYVPQIKNNYIIIGIIAGLIISCYGRFVQNIPTKIFKMPNPNMFHIYATLTWVIFYSIFGYLFLNNL